MRIPSTPEVLNRFEVVEFCERAPELFTGHMATWPRHIRNSLTLAEKQWRQTVGRIHDSGVTTLCFEDSGAVWCLVRIYFLHVRDEETVSQPNILQDVQRAESGASGGSVVPSSGGVARVPFSPSMCAAGIGGWGEWR